MLEIGAEAARSRGRRGGDRAGSPGWSRSWSRRTWALLLAGTLLVLAVAWVVEGRLRGETEDALARCRGVATDQVTATERSLASMADYLRPGLLAVPLEARDSLYVAMSEAAVDDVPGVRTALEECRSVEASWIHPHLQRRRDDYVEHLTETVVLLEAVVEDGRLYYRDTPELDAERERLLGPR